VTVELYPDFNVFEVAKPYARGLLMGRYTPRRIVSRARRETWELAGIARELPYQMHDVLEELRDGTIEVGFVHKGLDDVTAKLDVVFNRLTVALVVVGGLIGSSLIGILAEEGPTILGLHFLSVIGFAVSGFLGVWLLLAILRSGRL
jgi:ubiquinone biosynthesis protein